MLVENPSMRTPTFSLVLNCDSCRARFSSRVVVESTGDTRRWRWCCSKAYKEHDTQVDTIAGMKSPAHTVGLPSRLRWIGPVLSDLLGTYEST